MKLKSNKNEELDEATKEKICGTEGIPIKLDPHRMGAVQMISPEYQERSEAFSKALSEVSQACLSTVDISKRITIKK